MFGRKKKLNEPTQRFNEPTPFKSVLERGEAEPFQEEQPELAVSTASTNAFGMSSEAMCSGVSPIDNIYELSRALNSPLRRGY